MMDALLRILNSSFGRVFPAKRIHIRAGKTRRFFDLSPLSQLFFTTLVALIIGWSFFSFAYLAATNLNRNLLGRTAQNNQGQASYETYENRIKELSVFLSEANQQSHVMQARYELALEQISKLQTSLLETANSRKELQGIVETLQQMLIKTATERNNAHKDIQKILALTASQAGTSSRGFSDDTQTRMILDLFRKTLLETSRERDALTKAKHAAEQRAQKALEHLDQVNQQKRVFVAQIEDLLSTSLAPIEKMFHSTGHDSKILIDALRNQYQGSGGPLAPLDLNGEEHTPDDPLDARIKALFDGFEKLTFYRLAAEKIPYSLPIRSSYRLSSGFGKRRDPITRRIKMHYGIDFAGPRGTPIYATASGRVVFAGYKGGYGRVIEIKHDFGYKTRYAHLHRIRVKRDQQVSVGQRIGDMGKSGRSTGTHLHYEVTAAGQPINAMKYIRATEDVF